MFWLRVVKLANLFCREATASPAERNSVSKLTSINSFLRSPKGPGPAGAIRQILAMRPGMDAKGSAIVRRIVASRKPDKTGLYRQKNGGAVNRSRSCAGGFEVCEGSWQAPRVSCEHSSFVSNEPPGPAICGRKSSRHFPRHPLQGGTQRRVARSKVLQRPGPLLCDPWQKNARTKPRSRALGRGDQCLTRIFRCTGAGALDQSPRECC